MPKNRHGSGRTPKKKAVHNPLHIRKHFIIPAPTVCGNLPSELCGDCDNPCNPKNKLPLCPLCNKRILKPEDSTVVYSNNNPITVHKAC